MAVAHKSTISVGLIYVQFHFIKQPEIQLSVSINYVKTRTENTSVLNIKSYVPLAIQKLKVVIL